MKREYGISKEEFYLNYSWDQIQTYLLNLPPERVINLDNPNLSKQERQTKFLEALYDRDTVTVESDKERYEMRVRKLEIKNQLKENPDDEELKSELEQIKIKLGE